MNDPAPSPTRRSRWSIPRPLVALLVAVLALGTTWAFVNPMMQAPDEQVHLGYVQYLAETGDIPGRNAAGGPLSSEEFLAAEDSNAGRAAQQLGIQMTFDRRIYEAWREKDRTLQEAQRTDGGGPNNPANSNPPLYYASTVPAYLVASGGDFFTRLFAVRMVSVLWLLVTVLGAWLLAGELFGRRRLQQTIVAGVVGLAPMDLFVSSSVTPDAALIASWSMLLWLGVRLLRRGLAPGRVLAFFFVLGCAFIIKATSYALLPAALLVLVVAILRARKAGRTAVSDEDSPRPTTAEGSAPPPAEPSPARRPDLRSGVLVPLLMAGLGLLVTFGVWIVISRIAGVTALAQASDAAGGGSGGGGIRGLFSYLWKFYLPELPGMNDIPGMEQLPVFDVLFKGAWATFGWREVLFPDWVYSVLLVITVAIVVGTVWSLVRGRRRIDPAIAGFVLLVFLGLMGGLHLTEFQKGGAGFIQGRYLLPLMPLAGVAVALTIGRIPLAARGVAVGGALGGLLVLNLFSVGLVLERFYA